MILLLSELRHVFDITLRSSMLIISTLQELSPFPYRAIVEELSKYRSAESYRWVQEEPQNAGAWEYIAPRFSRLSAPVRHPAFL